MASLYFINEHGFFDASSRFADLLGGTRGSIRNVYRILKNKGASSDPGEFGIGDKTQVPVEEAYSVMNSSMTSKGPAGDITDNLMGDFAPQIAKLVAMAPITMIRGQAAALDPAYAKMNDLNQEDPCVLKDGAGIKSIRPPNYTFPDRTINDGLKGGQYVPVNIGAPIDIGLSVAMMGNLVTFPFGVRGLQNALTHTFNAISGDSSTKAYGAPLGPLGLLAINLPHLTGEVPRDKKRAAGCSTGSTSAPLQDAAGNEVDGNGEKLELQRCEDNEEQQVPEFQSFETGPGGIDPSLEEE